MRALREGEQSTTNLSPFKVCIRLWCAPETLSDESLTYEEKRRERKEKKETVIIMINRQINGLAGRNVLANGEGTGNT